MKIYHLIEREKDSRFNEFNTINYFLHKETAEKVKSDINNNPFLIYEIKEIEVISNQFADENNRGMRYKMEEYKEINYHDCHFKGFNNGIMYSVNDNGVKTEGLNVEQFGIELKELMEKHHIKSICPTHASNSQITKFIKDNQIHFVGMYFQSE